MNRRDFLALSGLSFTPTLLPEIGAATPSRASTAPVAGADLYAQLVERVDESAASLMERQEMSPGDARFGGVADRHGIYTAQGASGVLRHLGTAWVCRQSRHYHASALVERMLAAARFLRSMQHADGTIDLHTTNFHSPPDTAFVMEHVCLVAHLLRADGSADSAPVLEALEPFIAAAAQALVVGGIHTPNHRWVVCMALARAHSLAADPKYVARIDEWLGEKIDIDPDGQFTERSTAIYSPLTDRCLITVARLLERPELFEPVRRNLEMTLFYMHADGEIATEGSRRQDQYRVGSMSGYHYPYRYLALRDGNGRFAAVARQIAAIAPERLTTDLGLILEDPSLNRTLPEDEALPTNYTKHFRHSELVRIRRGGASATILSGNSTPFSLHKGSAAVVVRVAQAFFGKGQFVSDSLTRDGDGWLLEQNQEGPYYQPLAEEHLPDDGDWHEMDRERRPQSEVQRQRTTLRVTEKDGVFEVHVQIEGTDRVPVAVELGFRGGGQLHGVEEVESISGAWLFGGESGRFDFGEDRIDFGPGRREHVWTDLRGALPKLPGDSVYVTGFTPFDWTLRLS